ncbi:MAG: hypothetical protein IJY67_05655 [Paludibacteraceae bacterium]|nr:hypothetical protein [Paludibacteraceae bacterium]
MKKITLFLLTILISCSAWAINITGGTKLYLKTSSNWDEANAWFAAYFCNGSSAEQWIKMTKNSEGLYEVEVPSGKTHKNVIFLRMNPSNKQTSGTSWPSNVWEQTADLEYNGVNNIYVIQGWNSGSYWDIYINQDSPNFYVTGLNGKWDANAYLMTWNQTEKNVEYTHNLTKGTHEFKITNGTWDWNLGHKFFDKNNSDVESTGSGENNIKINITNDAKAKICLASYTKISVQLYYDVEVTTAGTGGTVSGGGENIRYNKNTKITATPDTGYQFVQWTDGDKNASREITVTKNETYTATFAINTYTVSVSANNAEWGTVSGDSTYNHGATATLTATPNDGYKFVKWDDGNTDNPRTITVTKDTTYTATFEELEDVEFSNPSILTIGETYGKLSYRLEMPNDRWYWIVLPYNVNVSEIETSTGGGWNDLVFTEYDAQRRAGGGKGWINWKTEYTDKGKAVPTQLQANKGYVIGPKTTAENGGDKFPGWTITFPSDSATNTVTDTAKLETKEAIGSNEKDNNWHIIGTGLYHNASLEGINYVALPAVVNGKDSYEYKYITSKKEPFFTNPIGTNSFAPFEAFFVQYGGEYSATATVAKTSAELAPVARAKAQEQEQIYLINMNEAHTVVILNAEGSEGYTAGEDFLEMNVGSRIEMIYSFDAEDALAFNHRATEAQSIALGGYVATAGEQTISLDAYNGNAEAVTLIDNVTGTTTDLLAEDYTFTAEVGSLDGRFTIVFAAQKAGSDTTVDCYNSIANQVIAYGTADHCTVSGLTAGEAIVVYNTMGQLVFATTADSETITLPSLTAGNYLILHNGTTNKVTLR